MVLGLWLRLDNYFWLMDTKNMKLISQFTAICDCCETFTGECDYEVLTQLQIHIKTKHSKIYKQFESLGRNAAKSQNGCGYFDSGKSKDDGWHKAQQTFRDAWIRKALERKIKYG